MKKSLLFIFLLLSGLPALCSNWQEIHDKEYIDVDSIKQENNQYAYAWFKNLNPGNWEKINNKYHHFSTSLYIFDCKGKKIDAIAQTSYGLKGEILNVFDYSSIYNPKNSTTWRSIVPDSIGELKYNAVCGSIK